MNAFYFIGLAKLAELLAHVEKLAVASETSDAPGSRWPFMRRAARRQSFHRTRIQAALPMMLNPCTPWQTPPPPCAN